MIEMVRGFAALMRGEWNSARKVLEQAETIFRDQCTGVTLKHDRSTTSCFAHLVQTGETRLKGGWSVFLRRLERRAASGECHDQAGRAAAGERLEAGGQARTRSFNLQHSNAFESLVHIHFYRSDFGTASRPFESVWPIRRLDAVANPNDQDRPVRDACPMCGHRDRRKSGRAGAFSSPGDFQRARLEKEEHTWAMAQCSFTSGPASPRATKTRRRRSGT